MNHWLNQCHFGDCLEVLRRMPDACVDSIVTDPPYHLTTGKKGGTGPASVDLESPYGRARVTTGFMGMKWDGGNIAQTAELWTECLRVLKPGGYLLAFSGTRTQHRMVCAIEDAGFEVRDQIGWAYGSGFPKSHNGEWGGTALKPAWEPICMARKPLIGTVAANVLAHGTGGLNIDACRIETNPDVDDSRLGGIGTWGTEKAAKNVYEGGYAGERIGSSSLGRWPANLIHDGSDEVLALFPQSAGQQGDVSGAEPSRTGDENTNCYGEFGRIPAAARNDAGSAARFFYCAKASKEDRDEGCDAMDMKALAYGNQAQAEVKRGNTAHKGDSGMNTVKMRRNHHPTVKPTDLMRYLCRLVTPKGGAVLDPFIGSGSTGRAAVLEGFQYIGIERDADYIEIARARIESARRQGHQQSLELEAT
jgi:site-specific DNA-methyltransferase (adenine-specific)